MKIRKSANVIIVIRAIKVMEFERSYQAHNHRTSGKSTKKKGKVNKDSPVYDIVEFSRNSEKNLEDLRKRVYISPTVMSTMFLTMLRK